ncbi:MAG: type II secretion system protein GspC, partial [Steroidobacteraceae bacterium]|nr:type II secretion system protein GspC [Steroidobacteraceae bacterium]
MGLKDKLAALGASTEGSVASRMMAHAPLAASAVIVIAIAAQAASIVWTVLTPPELPVVDSASLPAAPAATPVDVAAILAGRLFGGADASVDPNAVAPSSQNLILAGTIAGRDPERGWAILGDSAQNAKVYGTGMALPGGAKLKAVYVDRVILDLNGRLEALMLPRLSGAAGPAIVPATALPGPAPGALGERVRQLAEDQPNLLSQIIRPQPVFAGGQQKGYRVFPGRNRMQFAKLGLEAGDLITAINGTALDDPNRGMEMLRNLSAGDRVTVTGERE